MANDKPTVVLVHGAWADASSWTGVIQRLQKAGHDVVAPPNTLRGVTADAANVRTYLDTIDGRIVLVGHSYGGFVITNAATGSKNVKALVYRLTAGRTERSSARVDGGGPDPRS
jgi:pimeloyl-ACP methyl ester carboxylesterase